MAFKEIYWLESLDKKVLNFIKGLSINNFNFIRYSLSGDLYDENTFWGLGNFVFASKILYMIKGFDNLSYEDKENLYKNIIKFHQKGGWIYDPLITKYSLLKKFRTIIVQGPNSCKEIILKTRKAETRQSFSALNILDRKPIEPFLYIPLNKVEINNYLNSLNWAEPWSAGAHFSLLLFFLKINNLFFENVIENNDKLITYAFQWINKLHSKNDGSWYKGSNVSIVQKINGAMKVLTGLHAAGITEFDYPRKLIDLSLSAINDRQACDNVNLTYVLYSCSIIEPNYRRNEIEKFLFSRLNIIKDYYYPEYGGFSFFKNKANDYYYGFKISKGKNEPDIHGTVLFIWAITLIDKVLKLNLGFKIPLT